MTAGTADVAIHRQAALLDHAYDAIFAWEWDGPITLWNRGAERLYGYEREEAVGRVGHELLRTRHPKGLAAFLSALERDGTWEGELEQTRRDGSRVLVETRQVLVRGEGPPYVLAVNRDVTARKEAEERLRFLIEASMALSASLEPEATLAGVARLVVPRLADWCSVHLVGEDGAVAQVAVAHVDPAKVAWARELQERFPYDPDAAHGVPQVLRTGVSELIPEITDELLAAAARSAEQLEIIRSLGMTSAMIVPLLARGRKLGAITFVAAAPKGHPGRRYGPDDLAFAEELAQRCALAVDNARLYREAREAEARFRGLFEQAADGILVFDGAGRYLDANPAMTDLLGYAREELLAKRVGDLTDDGRPWVPAEFVRLREEGSLRAEGKLRHRDGYLVPVESHATPVDLTSGTVYLAMIRDVTERHRAEAALRASEEHYRLLFEHNPHPMWVIDGETLAFLAVNDAAVAQYGYSREEFLAMTAKDIRPPEDVPRLVARMADLPVGHNPPALWRHRKKDGTLIDVEVTTHGLTFDGRQARLVLANDVTERRRAEAAIRQLNEDLEERVRARTAELESANQELEAFSYSVSHDLRAPLRAIDGFSRILLEDYAADLAEDGRRYLRIVRDGTAQMGRLIDDLLAFSRLGRQPLRVRNVDPAGVVGEALAELRDELTGRRVEVAVDDLPACRADPALLKQVFANLLANALKYTRGRDPAIVRVGALDGDAASGDQTYFVQDNGVGFDMAYAPKLFGVFQRLHRAEEYEGTGVGLALVQRIVHRHGGRVWAEAEVNRGATFWFTLPAAAPDDVPDQGTAQLAG